VYFVGGKELGREGVEVCTLTKIDFQSVVFFMNYSLKSLLSLFSIIICFHAVEIREKWAEGREKGRSKELERKREDFFFIIIFNILCNNANQHSPLEKWNTSER
jgi:hypothetical protein